MVSSWWRSLGSADSWAALGGWDEGILGWMDGLEQEWNLLCLLSAAPFWVCRLSAVIAWNEPFARAHCSFTGVKTFAYSDLTDPCPHCRNFIQILVVSSTLCPLCSYNLHSFIWNSPMSYPELPHVYVSKAPHSAHPRTQTGPFIIQSSSLFPSLLAPFNVALDTAAGRICSTTV